MRWALLIFFIASTAFLGCNKQKEAHQETTLLKAYRLIDDNRIDEAISLLSVEIDRRDEITAPEFDQSVETKNLRVTLASAYAKKARISIREIAKSVDLTQRIAAIRSFEAPQVSLTNTFLSTISNMLLLQAKMIETLKVLPLVEIENVFFLEQAIKNIEIAQNLEYADFIYLAILKVVYARSLFDEFKRVQPPRSSTQMDRGRQCQVQIDNIREILLKVAEPILSAIQDLSKALPEKKSELEDIRQKLEGLNTDIKNIKGMAVLSNDLSPDTIKFIYKIIGQEIPDVCNL